MKGIRKIFISGFLFLFGTINYAQVSIPYFSIHKRSGDLLKNSAITYPFGISKFLPNLNFNNIDDWRSGSAVISINEIPYNTLPLNYTSPDLVPLDLLQLDTIEVYSESDIGKSSLPSGGINLKTKEISDSFLVRLRLFTGSETGDPLIYRFTRDEIPIVNKNKIVPSPVLSIEGNNTLKYRAAAGYFGYFAFNSSANSRVLSGLGNVLTKRQNRQIFGSGQLDYSLKGEKKISLFTSWIHFYGWELPPFITSFVHLRSLSFANRLTIKNLFSRLDAGIKYDGNISRIRELELTNSGKFGITDFSFFSSWTKTISEWLIFKLFSEAGRYEGFNSDPGTRLRQDIFDRSHSYVYYHLSPQLEFLPSEEFRIISSSRFEKNITAEHIYSGSLRFAYNNSGHIISLLFSSLASFPGMFEKFGKFYTLRISSEGGFPDTFFISGNDKISHERINSVSASYKFTKKDLEFKVNPYFRKVKNLIMMDDLMITPSYYPGDIVRNSIFINYPEKSSWGIHDEIKFRFHYLTAGVSHSGTYSKKNNPSNIFFVSSTISTGASGRIVLEYFYSSARLYKDFLSKNNLAKTKIFSAEIPEIHLFTAAYIYHISGLYYFKDIDLAIRVENLFNREIRFHPMGNTFDRTIEFYINFKI